MKVVTWHQWFGTSQVALITVSMNAIALLSSSTTVAQLAPDSTLGSEQSTIRNTSTRDLIEGGARRGRNLFHSFEQFNINEGQRLYFANPDGVINIINRVTGSNPSNILGTLGVQGSANLFLINPNGIVFGKDAVLDVRGSFLASTADSLRFSNQGVFSATNPETPPLLTINPDALLFTRQQSSRIENQSISDAGTDLLGNRRFGLQVPEGQSLVLAGGEIVLDQGGLYAPTGRIELAAIAGVGQIDLSTTNNRFTLSFPDTVERSNISLRNNAIANTSGNGGGSIQVWGKRIVVSDGSEINATTLGTIAGEGTVINASELIRIIGESETGVRSSVLSRTEGSGNAGSINLRTPILQILAGARITAATRNSGNAGNLTVNATDQVLVSGFTRSRENGSDLFAQAGRSATGNAGTLTIKTGKLIVDDGGQVAVSTFGQGNGGQLNITAAEVVVQGSSLSIIANNANFSSGSAGDLVINTGKLVVRDGAEISASTTGSGNAGRLLIRATESAEVSGESPESGSSSLVAGAFGSTGNAGELEINTPLLQLFSGEIAAATMGAGKGGRIRIQTGRLISEDGIISTTAYRTGEGGSVNVRASESIRLSGLNQGIVSQTLGEANAGTIFVSTPTLTVQNEAHIATNTRGRRNAGSIEIQSDRLLLQSGGSISTITEGSGNAGSLRVSATESIQIDGLTSGLFSAAVGSGKGGNMGLQTPILIVQNRSRITAAAVQEGLEAGSIDVIAKQVTVLDKAAITVSSPNGRAGNLNITANSIRLNQGELTAETGLGSGANIALRDVDILLLRDNSLISAQAFTNANGGNISIDARNGVVVAVPNQNNDIIAIASQGRGGDISITTQGIFGIEQRIASPGNQSNDIDASSQFNRSGIVTINRPDVDPTQSLAELPSEPRSPQPLASCQPGRSDGGRFVATGTGGIPINPSEPLSNLETLDDLALPTQQATLPNQPIREAEGWVRNAQGEVVLVDRLSFRLPCGTEK